jgi:hypothetical protein
MTGTLDLSLPTEGNGTKAARADDFPIGRAGRAGSDDPRCAA